MPTSLDSATFSPIRSAHSTIDYEIDALKALKTHLDGDLRTPFLKAVETIKNAEGRLIVTGMGKSGHIARKLAATLASTGTPAFFVHPGEASHGDLGMIRPVDAVLALSWSGETAELANIISYTRRFKVPLIAITSGQESSLSKQADICLCLPPIKEACPHGLAPTSSTTVQLCLGDALAIALLESHGFTASDFKIFHPGGSLGASLRYVRDLMHKGDYMPLVGPDLRMSEAILVMSQRGFGCVGVTAEDGRLIGMITDGDLRRHLTDDLLTKPVSEIMTHDPKTLTPDILVPTAIELLNRLSITAIFVVEDQHPVGILHMHDFLRIGTA